MNRFLTGQIHTGQVSLSLYVIVLVSALVIGSTVVFFLFLKNKRTKKLFFDTLSSSLLIIVISWKIYPLFGSFSTLVKDPLALLYSPGGIPGVVSGIILAILFFLYRTYKDRNLLKPFLIFMGTFTVAVAVPSLLFMVKPNFYKDAHLFTGKTTEGVSISPDNYKDKTIILNFFATWCPPCKGELPVLISFAKSMNKENTLLIGIDSFNSEKSAGYVKDFIKSRGINYPVILDNGNIADLYKVKTLPTTIIISPTGKILLRHQGVVDNFLLKSQF